MASSLAQPSSAFVTRALWAIVLGTSALRLIGIDDGLLGPSEWRETETASIARSFLEDPRLHLPRVNWGAPGPGYVECELPLFPWLVHLLYRAFGTEPWLGRALAVLLTAATTLVFFRVAVQALRVRGALLATLAFASSPLVFRYGRSFMPEAAVLLCYVATADRWLVWLRTRRWAPILQAGVCMALAALIKPTSLHLGLAFGVTALLAGGPRLAVGPQMLAFGAITLVPATLWFAHAAELHQVYGNTFGVISGGDAKWGDWRWWGDKSFYATLFRLDRAYALGWGGSALAGLGLIGWRFRGCRWLGFAWLLAIFVYYLIVARYAGHEGRGLQYHVYVAVPLALCAGGGIVLLRRWLSQLLPGRERLVLALAALPFALMLGQQWLANWRIANAGGTDLFARAGAALASVSHPDDLVVVTSTDVASDDGVPNNFEEPKVFYHAWRRGRSLPKDRLTAGELQGVFAMDERFRWVVVFDEALAAATPDFREALAKLDVAKDEPGFKVYRARGL